MGRSWETRLAALGGRALRTRPLVRAPLWLYRYGLGGLLGQRFVMLEHTGRRSGRQRRVVLEVLEVLEHPEPTRYLVLSGFGEHAQWYRNVLADPQVRISVGRLRSEPATAWPLDESGAADAVRRYADLHPRAYRMLASTLEQTLGRDPASAPVVELEVATAPA